MVDKPKKLSDLFDALDEAIADLETKRAAATAVEQQSAADLAEAKTAFDAVEQRVLEARSVAAADSRAAFDKARAFQEQLNERTTSLLDGGLPRVR